VPRPGGGSVPLRQLGSSRRERAAKYLSRIEQSLPRAQIQHRGRDNGSVVNDAIAAVTRSVKLPDGYYFHGAGSSRTSSAHPPLEIIVPLALARYCSCSTVRCNQGGRQARSCSPLPSLSLAACSRCSWRHAALGERGGGLYRAAGSGLSLGLLLVSAIEDKRKGGAPLLDAVIEGSTEKIRAVLMAGLLALFGLLPMALSQDYRSETQRPFALVIVGAW